jgi:hypothetical protein
VHYHTYADLPNPLNTVSGGVRNQNQLRKSSSQYSKDVVAVRSSRDYSSIILAHEKRVIVIESDAFTGQSKEAVLEQEPNESI